MDAVADRGFALLQHLLRRIQLFRERFLSGRHYRNTAFAPAPGLAGCHARGERRFVFCRGPEQEGCRPQRIWYGHRIRRIECDGANGVELRCCNRDVDRKRRFPYVRHRAFRRQHMPPCAELRLQGQFEHDRGARSLAEYAIYDACFGRSALRPVDVMERPEVPIRCGFSVVFSLQDDGRSLVTRSHCNADICERSGTNRFGRKVCCGHDGHIQLTQAQRFDGEVQRGKAGSRLGRHREPHALEIMRIGHAIGGHVRHGT